MSRINAKNLSSGMLVSPLLVLLFVPAAAPAQVTTPQEEICADLVQNKVAWNKAGNTTWNLNNVRRLCKGTTDPAATIACFKNDIARFNDWSSGIANCSGPVPGEPARSLRGNWTGYWKNGNKSAYVWRISQRGPNLDFLDVGGGSHTHFTGRIADNTVTDSNHKTGLISPSGGEIRWSDGIVWRKNLGSPTPADTSDRPGADQPPAGPGPAEPSAPPTGTGAVNVQAQATGAVRENPKDGLKYVWIPPGTFMMGCSPGDTDCRPDEKPAHRVTITKGFWMGQTEVTARAYKRFAGATGRQMPGGPNKNENWADENAPISNMTWNDAQAYCGWTGGRLPTEAEYEYAARGGSKGARYGDVYEIAWFNDNSMMEVHDVGQKRPNAFGLYDMLGNIYEWVSDWYDPHYYQNSPPEDPTGPASGQGRVLRAAGWGDTPQWIRASQRATNFTHGSAPSRSVSFGFRCVRVVNIP